MSVRIRKGVVKDIASVFSLVRELAVYEKAPNEVTTNLEEYIRLYRDGLFDFYVAEKDDVVVGIALYYFTFSTWKGKMLYLEDFVVRQSERGQGIGRALFDAIITEAKNTECALMKWEVLDWNESAIRFYEKYDSTFDKEWWNGKLYFR